MSAKGALSTMSRETLEGISKEMAAIVDTVKAEGRDMTPEEVTTLKAKMAEASKIREHVALVTQAEDIKLFLGNLSEPVTPGNPGSHASPFSTTKSFGAQLTDSEQFGRMLKVHAPNGRILDGTRVQMDPFEVKGLAASMHGRQQLGRAQKALVATTLLGTADLIVPDRTDLVVDLIGDIVATVVPLMTRIPTDSDTVEYVTVTAKGTNAAAVVAEATSASDGAAPESTFWTFAKVTKTIDAISHYIPVTRRTLSDISQMRGWLNTFLLDGLAKKVEAIALAAILASSPLTVGSAGTDLDAIVDAIKSIRVTGRRNPTAIVMHPNDWYSTGFALAKDSTGRYLLVDPTRSVDDGLNLWGRELKITDQMTENTVLVGDFKQAVLWDRQSATLSATDSHDDWFIRGLVAILAELRAAVSVLDPQAFCTVTAV